MAKVEKRSKLTDKQYALLIEANKKQADAFRAAEEASKYLSTISALILDSKGLPETLQASIDETTKELVYSEEVPGEAED